MPLSKPVNKPANKCGIPLILFWTNPFVPTMFHHMCSSFVYIVATGKNGQFHSGLTSNLVQRVWQHRSGQMADIGIPPACGQLVWYEAYDTLADATAQLEKLARWPDAWTTRLIEEQNPNWGDLWASLDDQPNIGLNPDKQYISAPPETPAIKPTPAIKTGTLRYVA